MRFIRIFEKQIQSMIGLVNRFFAYTFLVSNEK